MIKNSYALLIRILLGVTNILQYSNALHEKNSQRIRFNLLMPGRAAN